jgi:hypothetical protein
LGRDDGVKNIVLIIIIMYLKTKNVFQYYPYKEIKTKLLLIIVF